MVEAKTSPGGPVLGTGDFTLALCRGTAVSPSECPNVFLMVDNSHCLVCPTPTVCLNTLTLCSYHRWGLALQWTWEALSVLGVTG